MEAEGVDHSFKKFGRQSQERKGVGTRGGSRVKQRFSGQEKQVKRQRGLWASELHLPSPTS